MNILFISDRFPTNGGIETVTRTLANAFANREHSVFVCYRIKSRNEFVDYRVGQYQFPKTSGLEKIDVYSQENIGFLHNLLVEKKIQVLINQHAFNKYYNDLCKKAKQGLDVAFIQCHHFTFFWFMYSKPPIYLPIFLAKIYGFLATLITASIAIKNSDKLVLLSESHVEQCKKMFPWKRLNSVIAISNPMPSLNIVPINLSQKENIILYVGRMVENIKRMSMIVKCWSLICNKYKDWKLVFVGDGPDLEKTKKIAKPFPNVCFEGFKDSAPYFARACMLLMTSRYEGLPMTLIESQNFGCIPVAMNNFVSVRDIIDDGQNGFIIPNGNLDVLIEKVCLLIDNALLREKMAKNGMESIKKFSVENIVEKWEQVWGKICL
jgi:glycosyltransferase involved in cell wall biosynthesis